MEAMTSLQTAITSAEESLGESTTSQDNTSPPAFYHRLLMDNVDNR